MSRKKARESAFKLLYHWDMMEYSSEGIATTLDETIECDDLNDDDNAYIEAVLSGVREHQAEIDGPLRRRRSAGSSAVSRGWTGPFCAWAFMRLRTGRIFPAPSPSMNA